MKNYQLELRQIVDYPRCRIYREFIQTLIADRSIRTGGCSGLFYYVVLCAYANFRTSYSKHPEAKKLRPSKAASHVPAWRANQPQEKQTPSAPPSQAAGKKPAQKKKPAPAEKVVAVTKESIMKKKEDT